MDVIAAWGQVAADIIALIGIPLVLWQLAEGNRQQRVATRAATSQDYGLVSGAMDTVNQLFVQYPEYYPYFFSNSPVPSDPGLEAKLLRACDVLMGLVDAVTEQKRALPDHVAMDWSTWETYMRDLYANSPIFRRYLTDQLRDYPDYTFAGLGYLIVRRIVDGKQCSTWTVDEEEPFGTERARGYPWISTWRFTKMGEKEPAVTARVTGVSTNEVLVTMSHAGASERELCVIQYWIIGTMEGTTVREVRFAYPDGSLPEGELYRTGRWKRDDRTFAFVIPEYEPVWDWRDLRRRWDARFSVITE